MENNENINLLGKAARDPKLILIEKTLTKEHMSAEDWNKLLNNKTESTKNRKHFKQGANLNDPFEWVNGCKYVLKNCDYMFYSHASYKDVFIKITNEGLLFDTDKELTFSFAKECHEHIHRRRDNPAGEKFTNLNFDGYGGNTKTPLIAKFSDGALIPFHYFKLNVSSTFGKKRKNKNELTTHAKIIQYYEDKAKGLDVSPPKAKDFDPHPYEKEHQQIQHDQHNSGKVKRDSTLLTTFFQTQATPQKKRKRNPEQSSLDGNPEQSSLDDLHNDACRALDAHKDPEQSYLDGLNITSHTEPDAIPYFNDCEELQEKKQEQEQGQESKPQHPRKRRKLKKRERLRILNAYNTKTVHENMHRCPFCDSHFDISKDRSWEASHINSVSLGGTDDDWNYIPLCSHCNGNIEINMFEHGYNTFGESFGETAFNVLKCSYTLYKQHHGETDVDLTDHHAIFEFFVTEFTHPSNNAGVKNQRMIRSLIQHMNMDPNAKIIEICAGEKKNRATKNHYKDLMRAAIEEFEEKFLKIADDLQQEKKIYLHRLVSLDTWKETLLN